MIAENRPKNNFTNVRTGEPISGKPPFVIGDMISTQTTRHLCVDAAGTGLLEWFVDCLACRTRKTIKAAPEDEIQAHNCQVCQETAAVTSLRPRRRRRRGQGHE